MNKLTLIVSSNCPKCDQFKEKLTAYCITHSQTFNVKLMSTDADETLNYARTLGVSSVPTFVYEHENGQALGHEFDDFIKILEVTA